MTRENELVIVWNVTLEWAWTTEVFLVSVLYSKDYTQPGSQGSRQLEEGFQVRTALSLFTENVVFQLPSVACFFFF